MSNGCTSGISSSVSSFPKGILSSIDTLDISNGSKSGMSANESASKGGTSGSGSSAPLGMLKGSMSGMSANESASKGVASRSGAPSSPVGMLKGSMSGMSANESTSKGAGMSSVGGCWVGWVSPFPARDSQSNGSTSIPKSSDHVVSASVSALDCADDSVAGCACCGSSVRDATSSSLSPSSSNESGVSPKSSISGSSVFGSFVWACFDSVAGCGVGILGSGSRKSNISSSDGAVSVWALPSS